MSLLSNYKVNFFIKNIQGEEWESMESVNMWLTGYVCYYRSSFRADRLLSSINKVIDGTTPIAGGITQAENYCSITQSVTKIYWSADLWFDNPNIQPDFQLPTSDFKVIFVAWRDFLVSRGK